MFASHRELVAYLARRGDVSEEDIVTGDLQVVDASSRNRNTVVLKRNGPQFMVKMGTDRDHASQAREAHVYMLLHEHGDPHLSQYIPRLHAYDPDWDVLILELIPNAQTLSDYHLLPDRDITTIASTVGQALALVHNCIGCDPQRRLDDADIGPVTPWVLTLHRPNLSLLTAASNANVMFMQRIQESQRLCAALEGLRRSWRYECVIHHDLKWDNCIRNLTLRETDRDHLKIIDWELAGLGDPAWDVGTMVANYLSLWLLSLPLSKHASIDQVVEYTPRPLKTLQPAIRSFLQAYLRESTFRRSIQRTFNFG